jgi:hypothetical protein
VLIDNRRRAFNRLSLFLEHKLIIMDLLIVQNKIIYVFLTNIVNFNVFQKYIK